MNTSLSGQKCRHEQHGGILKAFIWVILVVLAAGAIGLGFTAYKLNQEITEPGPLAEEKVILVKTGMGVNAIAKQLEESGVIESDMLFKVAVRLRGVQTDLQAGEYLIPENASVNDIIDILLEGKPFLHNITFPEGLTTKQIHTVIASNNVLDGEITIESGEGELLPETYSFVRGDQRDDLIKRMQRAQDAVIGELWERRSENLPINTIDEAIVLASIVEKETGVANERPLVASVFVNRLRKGMRLESDPTVIYGLTGGEPLGRGIRVSELKKETPYNTYIIRGLPPTPIANPGRDSIDAVLNPADTDYIFFVADGSGGHAFANTLSQHNANVRKWREIERQRNGG